MNHQNIKCSTVHPAWGKISREQIHMNIARNVHSLNKPAYLKFTETIYFMWFLNW